MGYSRTVSGSRCTVATLLTLLDQFTRAIILLSNALEQAAPEFETFAKATFGQKTVDAQADLTGAVLRLPLSIAKALVDPFDVMGGRISAALANVDVTNQG